MTSYRERLKLTCIYQNIQKRLCVLSEDINVRIFLASDGWIEGSVSHLFENNVRQGQLLHLRCDHYLDKDNFTNHSRQLQTLPNSQWQLVWTTFSRTAKIIRSISKNKVFRWKALQQIPYQWPTSHKCLER